MKCPTCSEEMAKQKSYGEVEFDICKQHGIWLDRGELTRIVEAFGEDNRQPPQTGDRQTGRYEGIFLGWLSLFLPK